MNTKPIFQNPQGHVHPSSGNWRNDPITNIYRELIRNEIVDIFEFKTCNGINEWVGDTVTFLEGQLFKNAASVEDYINYQTLRQRLQIVFLQEFNPGEVQPVIEYLNEPSLSSPSGTVEVNSHWFNNNCITSNANSDMHGNVTTVTYNNNSQFSLMNGSCSNKLQEDNSMYNIASDHRIRNNYLPIPQQSQLCVEDNQNVGCNFPSTLAEHSGTIFSSNFMIPQHDVSLENPKLYSLFLNKTFSGSSDSNMGNLWQSAIKYHENQSQPHQTRFPFDQTLQVQKLALESSSNCNNLDISAPVGPYQTQIPLKKTIRGQNFTSGAYMLSSDSNRISLIGPAESSNVFLWSTTNELSDSNNCKNMKRKRVKTEKGNPKCMKRSTVSYPTNGGLEVDSEKRIKTSSPEIKDLSISENFTTENSLCIKAMKTENTSFQTLPGLEVDHEEGIKPECPNERGLSTPEIFMTEHIGERTPSPKCLKTKTETQQQLEFDNEEAMKPGNPEIGGLSMCEHFTAEKNKEQFSSPKCTEINTEAFQTHQGLEVDLEEKVEQGSLKKKDLPVYESFTSEHIGERTPSPKCVKTSTKSFQTKLGLEVNHEEAIKPASPKIDSLSMSKFFTAEEIKEHISSLNKNELDEEKVNDENKCQLCGLEKLLLAPKPIYCSCCGALIKRNVYHYITPDEDSTKHCFCSNCYNTLSSSKSISFSGVKIFKQRLEKVKNNGEIEELWVQCDKCEGWQHKICGLYNDKSDLEKKAEYICPICSLIEKKSGYCRHSSNGVLSRAEGLPQTKLSNHIEQRLLRRLEEERVERAKTTENSFNEVQGAKDLVVRVVSSVKKKVPVNKRLLDIFQDENYPAEFPYTSKLILLFQKIRGVDVCIFGMFVQECGSECSQPNQRSVYISYIDSVKYFTPNILTASGEGLRTFVYHETLIGYLDFVKKRGFATCYIWACPSLKGDDYLFYCHPKSQKTPKSDKLRQWYHSMLRKAASEHIVVNCTNFYNQFFNPTGEQDKKITAARLPFFEGDFCSGAVEDVMRNIEKESKDFFRKETKNKVPTKRTLQLMGHKKLSAAVTKDILLMKKLEQAILPVKEDILVIHLQHFCTHCHEPILSGIKRSCSQCKNFHLCERCHDREQVLSSEDTHISNKGEKHKLSKVVMDLHSDTKDEDDDIIKNKLFENRQSFLRVCQENHYQFDTLRQAKHSTMMILYHLHNPD